MAVPPFEETSTFELRVDIAISRKGPGGYSTGDQLRVSEQVDLPHAGSFMEVAQVLGRFHELGRRIRAEAAGDQEAADVEPEQPAAAGGHCKGPDCTYAGCRHRLGLHYTAKAGADQAAAVEPENTTAAAVEVDELRLELATAHIVNRILTNTLQDLARNGGKW